MTTILKLPPDYYSAFLELRPVKFISLEKLLSLLKSLLTNEGVVFSEYTLGSHSIIKVFTLTTCIQPDLQNLIDLIVPVVLDDISPLPHVNGD
jgi:hypothetical protein